MKNFRIIIDTLMTLCFTLLMCASYMENTIHRILGIFVIVLFIIHQILNRNFYKNIFKGKYNKLRICYLLIDILLLIMMIIMIISILMVSKIRLGDYILGKKLHIISSYSIYILIGLHLGLHYNTMFKLKKDNKRLLSIGLIIFGLIFGINGLIKRKIFSKLTLQFLYPLYFEDNIISSLIDYLGILIIFMMIGYGIYNLLILKKKGNGNNE